MKSKHFFDLQFIQYYKGFELFRRWMMKHHSQDVDFSNLDFEAVDIEILADEAKEQEETTTAAAARGEDAADAGGVDLSQGGQGCCSFCLVTFMVFFFEQWLPPCFKDFIIIIIFCLRTLVASLFWGFYLSTLDCVFCLEIDDFFWVFCISWAFCLLTEYPWNFSHALNLLVEFTPFILHDFLKV